MAGKNIAEAILQHHQGREAERLALKYKAMRANAFAFLRGTAHLFYAYLPHDKLLTQTPNVWLCGDLHLENFGSFQGDNGLVYFDINDFDEAVLGPTGLDLLRFLVSIFIAAETLGVNEAEALALCHCFLDAYASALSRGKAAWTERDTAQGVVKDLLHSVGERPRTELLNKRTELVDKKRHLKLDGKKALPASQEQARHVAALMEDYAAQQSDPGFFKVLDIARRIAGTGSLGVERYIVLVEGRGSPDGNLLLDLKQALPPSPHPRHPQQPQWPNEAARVIEIQQRMQAVSPALLHAVSLHDEWYVLKELQPSQDKIDLAAWQGKLPRLEHVMANMGEVTAWAQLRSSGRQKSAIADALVEFGNAADWRFPLIERALQYSHTIEAQWQDYCQAYDQGKFEVATTEATATSPAQDKSQAS